MADIQTLPLSQSKKEVKNPMAVLGGPMGWLDETMELVVRGQGSFVNEGPVTGQGLEQLSQMPEYPAGVVPSEGSMSGFQKVRRLEHVDPEAKSLLDQELYQQHLNTIKRLSTEAKRAWVNERNLFHTEYRGTMDSKENVYQYHQTIAERKEAETLAAQIQRQRKEKLAEQGAKKQTAPKGAIGPTGDLLRDFENRNISWSAG